MAHWHSCSTSERLQTAEHKDRLSHGLWRDGPRPRRGSLAPGEVRKLTPAILLGSRTHPCGAAAGLLPLLDWGTCITASSRSLPGAYPGPCGLSLHNTMHGTTAAWSTVSFGLRQQD
ncbi:hypothetical protein NDU88_011987 [Pleurodeles waltl]|uniref:Uncharacterized protein n=1 Tax=Pleurodeles waltl TaxID=8319 RepID=A0AAV7R1L8_PLEWA|nr:hypothetical protein NDU88_011987 [Pleurodeles waltl]